LNSSNLSLVFFNSQALPDGISRSSRSTSSRRRETHCESGTPLLARSLPTFIAHSGMRGSGDPFRSRHRPNADGFIRSINGDTTSCFRPDLLTTLNVRQCSVCFQVRSTRARSQHVCPAVPVAAPSQPADPIELLATQPIESAEPTSIWWSFHRFQL